MPRRECVCHDGRRRIRVTAAHPLCTPRAQVTGVITSHYRERRVRFLHLLPFTGEATVSYPSVT
jgi:hypothetical protein